MDGQEFIYTFPFGSNTPRQTHGDYLALVLLCYSCLRDGI
jgi:hypothetical protein